MKLSNEIIMFSYFFWYFQYLKIYCSHCRLGAASLMDSHIDSTSEKRKSANICQNMIYQIPPRLKRNLYKIRNAWFGICSDWSQNHQTAIGSYLDIWDGLSFMNSNAFLPYFIFYTPIPLAIYKIAQRLYNDSIWNNFLDQLVYTTHANRSPSLTFLLLPYHWL